MAEEVFDFRSGEVLLIDKAPGVSSFGVVNRVRGIIRRKLKEKKIKVGHAGTLDPLATGLLVICTGKATKTIVDIQSAEKEYTGIIRLGSITPSYDLETEVDATFPIDHITDELLEETVRSFLGEQEQMPPIFSAKQVEGTRAYELARKGKEVKLKPSVITIGEFGITDIKREKEALDVGFRVICSKGTYIRSLAFDLGNRLRSGGHLALLRRTRIGKYHVADAISVDRFQFLLHGD